MVELSPSSAPLLSDDPQALPAKSNDYSDVVVMANNNNEAADKKIEIELCIETSTYNKTCEE